MMEDDVDEDVRGDDPASDEDDFWKSIMKTYSSTFALCLCNIVIVL